MRTPVGVRARPNHVKRTITASVAVALICVPIFLVLLGAERKYVSIGVMVAIIAALILLYMSGKIGKKATMYIILIAVAVIMAFPFYSMVVMATRDNAELYKTPPPMFFGDSLVKNFEAMIKMVNVPRAFANSLIISVSYTLLSLLFCSLGGYAFAMYKFRGKKSLFSLLMGTMMLPQIATLIPWFILMTQLGWINNFAALIIPGCASAFGIFWMRQYCMNNVPSELMDAARIDGCPEWQIFFRIVAPILKPAYSTLGIMCFTGSWNNFLNPFLVLRDSEYQTLPLMLKGIVGDPRRGPQTAALMMANVCVVIPVLIVFLVASKYFISGLTAGAIKE